MVIMQHSPSSNGWWEFAAEKGNICGGARSLKKSVDSSEHAARVFLSGAHGHAVPLKEAQDVTRHVFSCVPS
jgi:hypothetical protein